jgi:uncharacterized membrane protein
MRIALSPAISVMLVFFASSAWSEPDFLDVFTTKYAIKENSVLGEKSCAACHISDSDYGLNPFGKDVAKQLLSDPRKVFSPATLQAIEALDSDQDGVPNIDELHAGSLPGDAASGGKPNATPAVERPTSPEKKPFPPKNGFHPAIVHFPIALFLAGILLDLIGLITNRKGFMFAGWYNLMLAAITSVFAIGSGFLAMTLTKLPYKGLIYTHLLYAVSAAAAMWLMVSLRVHRHETMNVPARIAYYALATIGIGAISWAGHLGGVFVYGE